MNALHYILLGVITSLIIHLISSARSRKREREELAERQRVSDFAKRWKESEFSKRVNSTQPTPPIPPPDRKLYTYKATEPPPPSKRDDNDYLYAIRGYPFDSNHGYIPEDTSHHSANDHGGGGDFGGGGSTGSWVGSSDSGSSDSGSSSNND